MFEFDRSCRWVWLVVALAAGGALRAAEPARLTAQQRVSLVARLRASPTPIRLDAVRQLSAYPEPDSARLLIDHGLRDPAEEVRRAAYETLLSLKDNRAVGDFLLRQLERATVSDTHAPLILGAALSSDLAEVRDAARAFAEGATPRAKIGPVLAVALADRLAERRQRTDIVPLTVLARSKVMESFAARRAIVHALAQIDDVEAIDVLIGLLDRIDGEARADAVEYLTLVTQQKLPTPGEWAAWWNTHKSKFAFPQFFQRPLARTFEVRPNSDSAATYYGLPIHAKRLIFVLDTSASMGGGRIVAAKRELAAAITQLRPDVRFGVVAFNSNVFSWKPALVEANQAGKAEALQFVAGLAVGNNTATFDALQAAMTFDVEAVYLLTDGEPTVGRVVDPAEIVAAVSARNRQRRESIYTIGIAPGPIGSPFDGFLSALAERNLGVYRRVEE